METGTIYKQNVHAGNPEQYIRNKINESGAEDSDNSSWRIFNCYYRRFVSGRKTERKALSPLNFDIFLIF